MTDDPRGTPGHDAPRTIFVERRTYRRRRMADAAGLLPVLGAGLMVVPLLWQGGDDGPARTADVMLYIFGTWALLALLSALVSRDLGRDRPGTDGSETPDPGAPAGGGDG